MEKQAEGQTPPATQQTPTPANNFDVLKVMSEREMNLKLAPIGTNFLGATYNQKSDITTVKIAWVGNCIGEIMTSKLVGGLLLADKAEFEAVRRELGVK